MKKGEKRDGSFDVILKAVVKKHLTTQCCFNTFVINGLCFIAWVCIDEVAKTTKNYRGRWGGRGCGEADVRP